MQLGLAFIIKTSKRRQCGVDALISVFTHELVETTSDPVSTGWYFNTNGYENADQCAWQIGRFISLPDYFVRANVKIGNKYFLLQQNWVVPYNRCGLSYP
jgi:hypothetical protein